MHVQHERGGDELPGLPLLPVIATALASLLALASAAGAGDLSDPDPSGARYVGARACAGCHAAIAADWATSAHAQAFDRLQHAGRETTAECIACHTTGSGQIGGFAAGRPALAGVQCESCHGPGSTHTRLPDRSTIRREVADATCAACHTPAMSHGFAMAPARFRERAAHRREPLSGSTSPALPPAPPGMPAVLELYLMPFCPAGGEAAAAATQLASTLGEAVSIQLRYIVRRTDPDAVAATASTLGRPPVAPAVLDPARAGCTDDGVAMAASGAAALPPEESALVRGFSSLHGPPEVLEAVRQLALASAYPPPAGRILAYAAERAADPEGDWRPVARRHGFDPAAIEAAMPSSAAKLGIDADRCQVNGIAASPTFHMNGVRLNLAAEHDDLARAACRALGEPPAACAAIPRCARATDCRDPERPGFEGRCLDPGLPTARCTYAPPAPVTLHVLNVPDCAPCNPTPVVAGAREIFPALTVVAHDVTRGEGGALADALDIDALPAFVFAGAESAASFPVIADLLAPPAPPARGAAAPSIPAGARLLDPRVFPGPLFFRRPPAPRAIDLFLDATGPETLATLKSLAALRRDSPPASPIHAAEIRVHHVLELGPPTPPAPGTPLRLVQRGAEAHLVPPGAPELQSRRGPEDLAEARRQACIGRHGRPQIVKYLLDREAAGEVDAGDWRARVQRIGLDPARIGHCAGSGAADSTLEVDRRLAAELAIRPPALLVANRLRLDGLGAWNENTLMRALAGEGYGSPAAANHDGGTQR